MGSGYGGNSGYGNGSRNQYSRDQNGGRSSRSRMGSEYGDSSDYGYRRGRNQFSGSEYGIGGSNDNWGTGSNEGRSRRGYSEDQYLGRGRNRATRYDDDYYRTENR